MVFWKTLFEHRVCTLRISSLRIWSDGTYRVKKYMFGHERFVAYRRANRRSERKVS